MRGILGVLLLLGVLAGCGGVDADAEPQAGIEAMATCSDCHNIYVRCMSRATTPEAKANCEAGRIDCEWSYCPDPPIRGEVEAGAEAPDVASALLIACWQLVGGNCSPGGMRSCSGVYGETIRCTCPDGGWECPPY